MAFWIWYLWENSHVHWITPNDLEVYNEAQWYRIYVFLVSPSPKFHCLILPRDRSHFKLLAVLRQVHRRPQNDIEHYKVKGISYIFY